MCGGFRSCGWYKAWSSPTSSRLRLLSIYSLTNRRCLTNRRGLTNRCGLTNSRGLTTRCRPTTRSSPTTRRSPRLGLRQATALGVCLHESVIYACLSSQGNLPLAIYTGVRSLVGSATLECRSTQKERAVSRKSRSRNTRTNDIFGGKTDRPTNYLALSSGASSERPDLLETLMLNQPAFPPFPSPQ